MTYLKEFVDCDTGEKYCIFMRKNCSAGVGVSRRRPLFVALKVATFRRIAGPASWVYSIFTAQGDRCFEQVPPA